MSGPPRSSTAPRATSSPRAGRSSRSRPGAAADSRTPSTATARARTTSWCSSPRPRRSRELERSLQITEDVLRYLVTRSSKPVKARRDAAAADGSEDDEDVDDDRLPPTLAAVDDEDDETPSASGSTSPRARPRPRPSTDRGAPPWRSAKVDDHRQPRARSRDALHPQRPARDGVQRRRQPRARRTSDGRVESTQTDWYRVTVWGDRAERTAEQFRKGNKVFVEGRFRTREFEAKDGQKRDLARDHGRQRDQPRARAPATRTAPGLVRRPRRAASVAARRWRRPGPADPLAAAPSDDDLDDLPF